MRPRRRAPPLEDGRRASDEAQPRRDARRPTRRAIAFYRREGWAITGDAGYAPHLDLDVV